MPKPSHHIFICTNQRPPGHPRGSCGELDATNVMERMGMAIEAKGLFGKVLLTTVSCMGPCSVGPVIVVYPDGVWYNKVKAEDINEILDQHIGQGKKVERLEMPEELWG